MRELTMSSVTDDDTISTIQTLVIPIILIVCAGALIVVALVLFAPPVDEPAAPGPAVTPIVTLPESTGTPAGTPAGPALTTGGPSPVPTSVGTFSIDVSPESTSARPGDIVTYTLNVDADPGYTRDIELSLRVTAPFYDETYGLGTVSPPYPTTRTYDFQVPGYVPPFVTISGTLTATDESVSREEAITLSVT